MTLLEEMLDVYEKGATAERHPTPEHMHEAGLAAVLSHLARRGVEGLPSVDVAALVSKSEHDRILYAEDDQDPDQATRDAINEALDTFGHRTTAILAARDAALAEARAEIEVQEGNVRFARQTWDDLFKLFVGVDQARWKAEKRLAAVMALTEDDLLGAGLGPENKGIPGILALIRRRAGAEAGPDPDIAATVQEHAVGPMPPAPDELEYERNEP